MGSLCQGRQEGGGGQNTWGSDWLAGPKLVKRLVMGATVKMVGARNV